MAGAGHDEDDEDDEDAAARPIEVPPASLSAAALDGIIEAFVLREGTDYGEVEASFADKVRAVRRQLERGEAVIVYAPRSRSVDIVPARERPARVDGLE